MPANTSDIDLLLQYALLVAGEEDDLMDRQLGPIHLIKYVYLADLFHSRRNDGETFTGIEWRFYKFGPWSQKVNERIEPALNLISANVQKFPSDYANSDDWQRWILRDGQLLGERERRLPPEITSNLKRDIHRYGKDTPSLLDYVYRTPPMLSAAPNEILDFQTAVRHRRAEAEPFSPRAASLSERKMKKFTEGIREIRSSRKDRAVKKRRLVNPVKQPRYDDVYESGLAWLDELAGPELPSSEFTVEFSESVWKSATRKGDDIS